MALQSAGDEDMPRLSTVQAEPVLEMSLLLWRKADAAQVASVLANHFLCFVRELMTLVDSRAW